jgi:Tol biopolymer transport system component
VVVNLWALKLPRDGAQTAADPERLAKDAGVDRQATISAEGKMAAFVSSRSGTPDIWVKDLGSDQAIALGVKAPSPSWPVLSSGGRRIAYLLAFNKDQLR